MKDSDYFSNHALKMRFPWSLYHGPIVRELEASLQASPGPRILNVGSGPFFELSGLRNEGRSITICDIEPRAIALAQKLHGSRIERADVVEPEGPLPYGDGEFDLVVSMEVIEHTSDPVRWTEEVLRVIRPGGTFFLTTPNYDSTSLRVLEATALEVVARLQGFSRKHIHPNKMTPTRLDSVLREAGATELEIAKISLGWVLAARARKL